MSFWPKCAPNISFFASFTSVPSQEKIPITETEGHFGPNRSYQIGSVWFWDCFFANDIVFCNLYCFCAGYWLHGVSLERRECSELLFAKIRTIWDCYFVWDCVFLQLRLFFVIEIVLCRLSDPCGLPGEERVQWALVCQYRNCLMLPRECITLYKLFYYLISDFFGSQRDFCNILRSCGNWKPLRGLSDPQYQQ